MFLLTGQAAPHPSPGCHALSGNYHSSAGYDGWMYVGEYQVETLRAFISVSTDE